MGKTYALDEFCKENYDNYIYINLEMEDDIREVFENYLDPKRIIDTIAVLKGIRIDIESTVVFFDEIQVSERAISSLKYFNESKEGYNIVCAGSMLGVALNRFKKSFPVGKVYRQYMYPFDFEEYLLGLGEDMLVDEIISGYSINKKLVEPVHKRALELYKEYLYVGGMPASINEFIAKGRMLSTYDETIKRSILEDYLADMSKYTTSVEHIKVNKVYKSIPRQLGRDNNKFSYKLVDEKGSKRSFETSLEWLYNSYLTNNG